MGLVCIVSPYAAVTLMLSRYRFGLFWQASAAHWGAGSPIPLVRKLTVTEHPSVIVLYFPMVCLPGTLLLGVSDFVWPTVNGWWVLLGVGCFTQLGQLALTKAMQFDAASRVTSLSYVQIVFAAILGWLFFGEIPTEATLLGGGLILMGAAVSAWLQPKAVST